MALTVPFLCRCILKMDHHCRILFGKIKEKKNQYQSHIKPAPGIIWQATEPWVFLHFSIPGLIYEWIILLNPVCSDAKLDRNLTCNKSVWEYYSISTYKALLVVFKPVVSGNVVQSSYRWLNSNLTVYRKWNRNVFKIWNVLHFDEMAGGIFSLKWAK